MRTWLILIVCLLGVAGRFQSQEADAAEKKTEVRYFPKRSITDFEHKWYSKELSAMKEPVLSVPENDKTYFALRILCLPTWNHPVAMRCERKGDRYVRRLVMLSGLGGSEPGKIDKEKKTELPQKDAVQLIASLEKAGVWQMAKRNRADADVCDGTLLVVELIKDGKYSLIVRAVGGTKKADAPLSALVKLYTREFQDAGFWKENTEENNGGKGGGIDKGNRP
jgi:hypothetical protein